MGFYDEIEIEDMIWDDAKGVFHYPCPCGDRFEISRKQLANGEDIAVCPSCSLVIRIIYDYLDFEDEGDDDEEVKEEEAEESDDNADEKFEDAVERLEVDLTSRMAEARV
ncbi:zf-CSL-domain-containing protein [Dacryopinax primogenitus]|uniref:Diphthamide biosynthesis protein 3 n=1 Tax=Dacryopinax primogenitus (strain DJM 731) TaxID=1858805 RepID=M5FRC1_DACPD|nr:zf-CSL-domain-containing protein [Dacryopinax primogenitus]EJT98178.1 zf-CSL-domain-containing protein [Dacryopinax primogenitus]